MKITALIDEFQEIEIDRTQLFQKIKSKTNADALIVVTSGNFTQKGDFCVFARFRVATSNERFFDWPLLKQQNFV